MQKCQLFESFFFWIATRRCRSHFKPTIRQGFNRLLCVFRIFLFIGKFCSMNHIECDSPMNSGDAFLQMCFEYYK